VEGRRAEGDCALVGPGKRRAVTEESNKKTRGFMEHRPAGRASAGLYFDEK
jgi:hypothetical protein